MSETQGMQHSDDVYMDDFMDVVTVFRCKFCDFSCNDRCGMGNHVRTYHLVRAEEKGRGEEERQETVSVSLPSEQLEVVQTVGLCGQSVTPSRKHCMQVAVVGKNHLYIDDSHGSSTHVKPGTVDAATGMMSDCSTVVSSKANLTTRESTQVQDGEIIEIAEINGHDIMIAPNAGLPNDSVPVNKEVYLCGQCTPGFDNIEDCKDHMMRDHHLSVGSVITQEDMEVDQTISDNMHIPPNKISVGTQVMTRKKPGRKRKPKESLHIPRISLEEDMEEDGAAWKEDPPSIETAEETQSEPGRRHRRPPRRLTQLYYLGKMKAKKPLRAKPEPHKVKCPEINCNAKFRTETSLSIHLNCHNTRSTNSEEGPASLFKCVDCNEESNQWKVIRLHLWRQHNIDTDLYACDTCDFKIDSICKLESHSQIHGDARPFTCDVCNKSFKQSIQLRNHKLIHTDRDRDPTKWYTNKQCDICKRTFANQKCLKNHIEATHSKEKPYLCPYCGHATSRKAILELHVRTHTGEKPYKCNECTYATGDHNSLRRHKMRHTGEKPYKCQYCQYSAIQAISLKTHMKNKHPGSAGIYTCDMCQYRTVSEQNYHNHMADHRLGLIPTVTTPAPSLRVTGGQNWTEHDTTVEMTEGNINPAQLIYSALNAISQHGTPQGPEAAQDEVSEPSTQELQPTIQSSTQDGVTTHTITFHIPQSQEQGTNLDGQVLLAVEPQDTQQRAIDLEGSSIAYTTEVIPQMTEVMHHTTVPQLTEVVHQSTENTPHMTEIVQQSTEGMTHMTEVVHETEGVVVHETSEGVVVHETEGVVVHETSEGVVVHETSEGVVVHETSEGVPHRTEVVHQTAEGVPHSTEVVHQTAEGVPHRAGVVHQTAEGVPHSTEVVHQSSGVPHVTEVVHQTSEAEVVHHIEELHDHVIVEGAPTTMCPLINSDGTQQVVISVVEAGTVAIVEDGQPHYVTTTQS